MAVIFVTHDLGVVADIADRVVVMYAGQVVERATVHDLYARPAHPYAEGLLGSMPQVAPLGQTVDRHSRCCSQARRDHDRLPVRDALLLRRGRVPGRRHRAASGTQHGGRDTLRRSDELDADRHAMGRRAT